MSDRSRFDLTHGGILSRLLLVAVPIMGTQLLQMTFNLTDMFWLGRLSSVAVAATGTGGMYMWLSVSLMMMGSMGASIGVAQNLGRRDIAAARSYSQTALLIGIVLGVIYGGVIVTCSRFLVSFFALEASVAEDAAIYLAICGWGVPITFISSAITATFNASANSRVALYINAVGLIVNVILDPVLIFNFGMGVAGAAWATVFSQVSVCLLFLWAIKRYRERPFVSYSYFTAPDWVKIKQIVKWSTPVVLENALFTSLAMLTTRLIATFGTDGVAVGRIGSQIESLSWLIAGGFGSALTAFVGQNFGAGKWSRIHSSFRLSAAAMTVWGGVVMTGLLLFGKQLFTIFIPGEEAIIALGAVYLDILAYCAIANCIEGVAAGTFRGLGRTLPPSVISIASNLFRVVAAYVTAWLGYGLIGIWYVITAANIIRGLAMIAWYLKSSRSMPREDRELAAVEI